MALLWKVSSCTIYIHVHALTSSIDFIGIGYGCYIQIGPTHSTNTLFTKMCTFWKDPFILLKNLIHPFIKVSTKTQTKKLWQKKLLVHLCKYSIEFSSADFSHLLPNVHNFLCLSLSRHCLLVTSGRWKVSKKEKKMCWPLNRIFAAEFGVRKLDNHQNKSFELSFFYDSPVIASFLPFCIRSMRHFFLHSHDVWSLSQFPF